MDTADLYVVPRADDPLDAELREVDIAIEMVARGAALRVRLVGLHAAEDIAPIALARAQLAGVDFHVERDEAAARLIFGPTD
jgi:hypothetical protein